MTNISHVKDGITIASAAYTYDSTVNPLTMTSTEGQTSYQYDDIYELTNVTYPDNSSERFTYDLAGNRTSLNGISYIYDTANRLLQAGTDVYTYDQNGNRITENAKQYQYDWNNRLTSITSGDETTQFTYDGDGSRTSQAKIVSGATIEASSYIYDPSQGIPRLLQEEIVSGPTLSYVYAGRLLEQTGGSTGTMFYHHDAIGNTLAMTDMTGAAVNTYRYKAFGASELISGTALNNRQFTGHVSDNTGLIYMNARYYDPATGRFLTQDTVPGRPMDPLSYNLYAYCKNNPVAYTDPSGHWNACVHRDWLYDLSVKLGFSEAQAVLIALGCNSIDTNPETDPVSLSENGLSWHFNRENYWEGAVPGEDTRITHMNEELDVFRNNASSNPVEALYALGKAMHARQDMDAHLTQGINSLKIAPVHDYSLLNNFAEYEDPEEYQQHQDHFDDIEWQPEYNGSGQVAKFNKADDGYSDRFDETYQITQTCLESARDNWNLGTVGSSDVQLMSQYVSADDRKWAYDKLGIEDGPSL